MAVAVGGGGARAARRLCDDLGTVVHAGLRRVAERQLVALDLRADRRGLSVSPCAAERQLGATMGPASPHTPSTSHPHLFFMNGMIL